MHDSHGSLQANLDAYEEYYKKPGWWFRWRYDTQIKRKSLLALLSHRPQDWAGKGIFELGFGSGEVLLSFPASCEIFGAEISSTAITTFCRRASVKGYRRFRVALLGKDSALEVPTACIDLAIASHVLEHVNDDIMCLRELRRILKPGGALAVLIPVNERFEDPNHFRRYTSSSFRHICEAEGFAYISGFENELLYYLVETMYWKHADGKWPFLANAVRVLFNILTSRLPFWCYGVCDIIIGRLTGLPPRQSAMLFVKRDG